MTTLTPCQCSQLSTITWTHNFRTVKKKFFVTLIIIFLFSKVKSLQKCQCSITTTYADNVFRESYRKYKNRDIFFACSYGPQLDFLSKMSKKSRDTVSLIFVHVSFFNSVPLIRPSLLVYNTKNTISLWCQL